jgi:hypothetical protein
MNQANDHPRHEAKESATDPNPGPEKDIVEAVKAVPDEYKKLVVAEAIRAVSDQEVKKEVVAAAVQAASDNETVIKDVAATAVTSTPDPVKKDVVSAAVHDAAGEAKVDIATAAVTAVPDEAKKDVVAAGMRDASSEAKKDVATAALTAVSDEAKQDIVAAAVHDASEVAETNIANAAVRAVSDEGKTVVAKETIREAVRTSPEQAKDLAAEVVKASPDNAEEIAAHLVTGLRSDEAKTELTRETLKELPPSLHENLAADMQLTRKNMSNTLLQTVLGAIAFVVVLAVGTLFGAALLKDSDQIQGLLRVIIPIATLLLGYFVGRIRSEV